MHENNLRTYLNIELINIKAIVILFCEVHIVYYCKELTTSYSKVFTVRSYTYVDCTQPCIEPGVNKEIISIYRL